MGIHWKLIGHPFLQPQCEPARVCVMLTGLFPLVSIWMFLSVLNSCGNPICFLSANPTVKIHLFRLRGDYTGVSSGQRSISGWVKVDGVSGKPLGMGVKNQILGRF